METLSLGTHFTGFEEPDIIRMKLVGAVSADEGREISEHHRAMSAGRDRVFYLIDLSELDSIDPVGRKAAASTMKELPLEGVAIYRAPLKARVVAKLIFTALNLFKTGQASKIPFEFFPTEEDARAWIAMRREAAADRVSPPAIPA